MDYIDIYNHIYEQSFKKIFFWEQIYSINIAELRTYKKVHYKSKQRESELFHSYQEFDICRLHLHLDKFLENQSSGEDLVFLGQV